MSLNRSRRWRASDTIASAALAVSIVAAVIAFAQTQRANDLDQAAYALSKALAPKVDVFINSIDARGVRTDGELSLRVELELVNTGQVQLSGCNTHYENSDQEGTPTHYWPAISEPGGQSWGLAPGQSHQSVLLVPVSDLLSVEPDATEMYVAMWYECYSSQMTTVGKLYGIDIKTDEILPGPGPHAGEVHSPMATLPAMGSYARYNAIAQTAGRTPLPIPTPTPQFTLGDSGLR